MKLFKTLKETSTLSVATKFRNKPAGSREEMIDLIRTVKISKRSTVNDERRNKKFLTIMNFLDCLEQSTYAYQQAGCLFGLESSFDK